MTSITYQQLFEFLERLGFKDLSRSQFERIFEHSELEILLAFSMQDDPTVDRPVRDADVTSVEFRLQQRGLLSGRLIEAAERIGER